MESIEEWKQIRHCLQLELKYKYRDAEMYYRILHEKYPQNAVIANNLGVALFRRAEYVEAQKFFDLACQLSPDMLNARKNQKLAQTLPNTSRGRATAWIAKHPWSKTVFVFFAAFVLSILNDIWHLPWGLYWTVVVIFFLIYYSGKRSPIKKQIRWVDAKIQQIIRQQSKMHQEHERQQQQQEYENLQKQWLDHVLASGIQGIDRMEGVQFEQRMATHFEYLGWQVSKTPGSGDYGADLILQSPDGRRIAAQCKRYTGSVGISAVQEVLGAVQYYGVDAGMIITNSTLTKNAKELARVSGVDVWERNDLIAQLVDAQKERMADIWIEHNQENAAPSGN